MSRVLKLVLGSGKQSLRSCGEKVRRDINLLFRTQTWNKKNQNQNQKS